MLFLVDVNAASSELTLNPQVSLDAQIANRNVDNQDGETTYRQHMQLGINFDKRDGTLQQSIIGNFGIVNYSSQVDSMYLSRSIRAEIGSNQRSGNILLSFSNNKNNEYSEAIESVSINSSSIEYNSYQANFSIARIMSKKHTLGLTSSYQTSESSIHGVKFRGLDNMNMGLNLNYQLSKKAKLTGAFDGSVIRFHLNDFQVSSTQSSVNLDYSMNERLTISPSIGIFVTREGYRGKILRDGNIASVNLSYQTGARSSLSLSGTRELQVTDYGNFVERRIFSSNFLYRLSKRANVSAFSSIGRNEEVGISDEERSYLQFAFSSTQQLSRTLFLSENMSFGREQYDNNSPRTEIWQTSISIKYVPKKHL